MLDLILGWAVIFFPTALAVVFIFIPARSENESAHMKWRACLVVFGILFSVLAWLQQTRALKAANSDRESAIKETSARVAAETADRVTKAMTVQYEGTISGLNQQIGALQSGLSAMDKASMERSDRIAAGVGDAVKMQTGGDSFAFLTFTAEPAQAFEMHWNNFLAPKGEPYFLVSVTSHGKYPLRGTHAIMMDDERRLAAMQEYNTHPNGDWIKAINSSDTEYEMPYLRPQSDEAPQGEVDVVGIYPMPQGDSKRTTIHFSAPNGLWNEVLHLSRVNGMWHQCLNVMGPTVKQATNPFIYCDSEWPEGRALAEKDWAPVKRPSRQ